MRIEVSMADLRMRHLLLEIPQYRRGFVVVVALKAVACSLLLIPLAMMGCTTPGPNPGASILLFNGTGTSPNDVTAIERILKGCQLEYATVNSQQLNSMNESRLTTCRLFIVPGGNYIDMGDNLSQSAVENVHNAVQGGMNYLGICAGGLLAGKAPCHSFNLTSGVRFEFYAEVNRNIHKAAVPITSIDAPTLEHYWEDGPQFTGWGDVVGKYPDGTPAIVEGLSGKGWVILCGVHPEAPANWRKGMSFTTPTEVDHAYAEKLIKSALDGTALPHYQL